MHTRHTPTVSCSSVPLIAGSIVCLLPLLLHSSCRILIRTLTTSGILSNCWNVILVLSWSVSESCNGYPTIGTLWAESVSAVPPSPLPGRCGMRHYIRLPCIAGSTCLVSSVPSGKLAPRAASRGTLPESRAGQELRSTWTKTKPSCALHLHPLQFALPGTPSPGRWTVSANESHKKLRSHLFNLLLASVGSAAMLSIWVLRVIHVSSPVAGHVADSNVHSGQKLEIVYSLH